MLQWIVCDDGSYVWVCIVCVLFDWVMMVCYVDVLEDVVDVCCIVLVVGFQVSLYEQLFDVIWWMFVEYDGNVLVVVWQFGIFCMILYVKFRQFDVVGIGYDGLY